MDAALALIGVFNVGESPRRRLCIPVYWRLNPVPNVLLAKTRPQGRPGH